MSLSIRQSGETMVKRWIFGVGGFLACFALALTAGSILMIPNSSDAADSGVKVNIKVDPFLSMTASPTVAMTTTPSQSGTVTTGDITTNISTNNATGYTLSLSAKAAANVDLVHANGTNKILSSTNTSAAALANNTWGYNVKTGATPTTFLKIPTPTSPAALATTAAPSTDNRTVTVAVRADTTIPAGAYKSTLTLTAVANYVPIPLSKTGDDIQTVTTESCPTTRIRVVDARDNASYWIQKMADGRCWMLTNLAYGGGGTNTYGDAKNITNSNTLTYTAPYYMIPTGSNRTTGTTDPSTSTNGTGQYGYLYNWCAAMGAQTGTAACANATTPAPNTAISICPSGWRLPTSNTGGEFQQLTDAIGATTNGSSGGSAGSTNLRTTWLAMYSGGWYGSFYNQGSNGSYWSSTQHPSNSSLAYHLIFDSDLVNPSYYSNKQNGFAVRCIAV